MNRIENREAVPQSETIALLTFDQTPVLINETPDGSIRVTVAPKNSPSTNTKHYPPENIMSFPEIDLNDVTVGQIKSSSTTVRWYERTSGIDKPVFHLPIQTIEDKQPTTIEMTERELHDLFFPKGEASKKATFFSIDLEKKQLFGVILKRPSPVMLFLNPESEGGEKNPHVGLQNFVDTVYNRLTERLTDFQADVDDKIFEAMRPDGEIALSFDQSTPTKRRQRDIQKRIFRIQSLLLARKAEARETGFQDQALLTHAPILTETDTQQRTKLGKRITEQVNPTIIITNDIWNTLTRKPEEKLLTATGTAEGEELDRIEYAREILGNDFIGPEDIKNLQDFFNAHEKIVDSQGTPVEVSFDTETLPEFPTEERIALAKTNNEMLQFHPGSITLNGEERAITTRVALKLFSFDPHGRIETIVDETNKWWDKESWMDTETLEGEWVFVKKEPEEPTQRTLVQALWDTSMYYWKTGQRLLTDRNDVLSTHTDKGKNPLIMGEFTNKGIGIADLSPSQKIPHRYEAMPTHDTELASALQIRERHAWFDALHSFADIKSPPPYLTLDVIQKLEDLGMETLYIPNLYPDPEKVKNLGEMFTTMHNQYPQIRQDSSLWIDVKDGHTGIPALPGQWVAVETSKKLKNHSQVMTWLDLKKRNNLHHKDIDTAIESGEMSMLEYLGLDKGQAEARLLEIWEWDILAARYNWPLTMDEWTSTQIKFQADVMRYVTSANKNRPGETGWRRSEDRLQKNESRDKKLGFRLAIVFPEQGTTPTENNSENQKLIYRDPNNDIGTGWSV